MASGTKTNTSSWGLSELEQRLVVGVMVVIVCGLLWYVVYDAVMAPAAEHMKRLLMVSPLLLVVVVHWLSTVPPASRLSIPVPGSEPGAIHRAGGSPWGVAFLLLLLCFLITYQPSFHRLSL